MLTQVPQARRRPSDSRCGAAAPLAASFRDPAGFLFRRDGELYRQINPTAEADYRLLTDSGLYDQLVDAGLLIPHVEVDQPAADTTTACRVIRPEPVRHISYPYEWCFGQLQDAALATLEIQRRALSRGMWLKDASAYNVQLHGGRPVLIDTLSLERYPQGRPWVAYRQFCQHFLAPLALMSYGDARLGQLSRVHLDGVPLDLAARLLPWRARLRPGLALHLFAHARLGARHSEAAPATTAPRRTFSRRSLELLIDSLESTVRRLRPRGGRTDWADYYASLHNYTDDALRAKEQIVAEMLRQAAPQTVWDLGGNDGRFSRLAAEQGALAVCWDIDPVCVERNYRTMRQRQERNIVPLLLDLANPSPAQGWAHEERMSLADRGPADMVLALGLVHHLAIGNNVPLPRVAEFLARLGRRLIVEFVPKQDSQVQRMLASREDVFADYTQAGFEDAFGRCFAVHEATPIPGTSRVLYAMEP